MSHQTRSEQSESKNHKEERNLLMSANDINHILVNGAQISSAKLRRSDSHDARLFYFAEIGVYLEVSLSQGSGISVDTRERLAEIHQEALATLMAANISAQ